MLNEKYDGSGIEENKQGEVLHVLQNKEAIKKIYIESYGCQMNFSDSEIVASLLKPA